MNKKSKVLVYKPKTKIVVPSDFSEEYLKHHQKRIAREINKWCWEQVVSQNITPEVLETDSDFEQKEKLPLNHKLKMKKVGPILVPGFDDEEPFCNEDETKNIEEEPNNVRNRYLSDEETDLIEY